MSKASHVAARKRKPVNLIYGLEEPSPAMGHSPAGISSHFSHDEYSDLACRTAEDVAVTVNLFCAILNIRRGQLDHGNGGDITMLALGPKCG